MKTPGNGSIPEPPVKDLYPPAADAGTMQVSGASMTIINLSELKLLIDAGGEEAFHRQYLTAAEAKILARLTHHGRRLQWLGGRLTAKKAVWRMVARKDATRCDWRSVTVLPHPNGRPELFLPAWAESGLDVSISHSHNLAAAMADRHRCGLDIQKILPSLHRLRPKFAGPEEQDLLDKADCPDIQGLALLWTAKEAIRKAAISPRLPGFFDLRLTSITHEGAGLSPLYRLALRQSRSEPGHDCRTWRIRGWFREEYAMACTISTGPESNPGR